MELVVGGDGAPCAEGRGGEGGKGQGDGCDCFGLAMIGVLVLGCGWRAGEWEGMDGWMDGWMLRGEVGMRRLRG